MKHLVRRYGAGLFFLGLIAAAGMPGASAAEKVMDYFRYDTLPSDVQGEYIQYVKIDLNAAWNRLKVSTQDAQLCGQGDLPSPSMSVLQNTQPANPQNCSVTNYTWWQKAGRPFANVRFVVNANFFKIDPPNPYKNQCGKGLGVAINDRAWVSGQNLDDRLVHGDVTNTLIIYNEAGSAANGGAKATIVDQSYKFEQNKDHIQAAISGYRFMTDGAFVPVTSEAFPNHYKPRTAVGLSQDGRYLTFLSINPGYRSHGATLQEADHFYQALVAKGARNALYLDGGGSATLVLKNQQGNTLLSTLPSDVRDVDGKPDCSKRFYRPAPVVFGVR